MGLFWFMIFKGCCSVGIAWVLIAFTLFYIACFDLLSGLLSGFDHSLLDLLSGLLSGFDHSFCLDCCLGLMIILNFLHHCIILDLAVSYFETGITPVIFI